MSGVANTVLRWTLLTVVVLAGCTTARNAPPDTQATIDAAVAATGAAQAGAQATASAQPDTEATVAAAVEATVVAQAAPQATIDAATKATVAVVPTATPSDVYVTMSEQELEALIDEAVSEATTAAQASSTAAEQAAGDGTLTAEEVDSVEVYVAGAEEAISYAEELIALYYDLYADTATEMIAVMQAIEQDLAVIAASTDELYAVLQEVDQTLQQGLALAEETIQQLEAAAQAASATATQIQAQTQNRIHERQGEIEDRVAAALAVRPDEIAGDRLAAIESTFVYGDAVRQALEDRQISEEELARIAQLGANAGASLQAQGGNLLAQQAVKVQEITTQLARGDLTQAAANLKALETSLGPRPSVGSVPKPSRPSRP